MKKIFSVLAITLIFLVLLEAPQLWGETTYFTSFLHRLIKHYDLDVVSPGRFYRTSEMPNSQLADLIKAHRVKTVIDLRYGRPDPEPDGSIEDQVVVAAGAQYIHAPLLGSQMPTKQSVLNLLAMYDTASEPILVHCSSGSHRSGVASALWLIYKEQVSPAVAATQQLSPYFGYFRQERLLKSRLQGYPTIDNLIWRYRDDYARTGEGLRRWLNYNLN